MEIGPDTPLEPRLLWANDASVFDYVVCLIWETFINSISTELNPQGPWADLQSHWTTTCMCGETSSGGHWLRPGWRCGSALMDRLLSVHEWQEKLDTIQTITVVSKGGRRGENTNIWSVYQLPRIQFPYSGQKGCKLTTPTLQICTSVNRLLVVTAKLFIHFKWLWWEWIE